MARQTQPRNNAGLQRIAEDIAAVRDERMLSAEQLLRIEEGISTLIARPVTVEQLNRVEKSLAQAMSDMGAVRNDLATEIAGVRTELMGLRGDIIMKRGGDTAEPFRHFDLQMTRWFIGMILLIIACTVILFLHH